METFECINTRRSIRKFSDKPIKKEIIGKLVMTAMNTPTWKNTQIGRFTAITNRDKINELIDIMNPWNKKFAGEAPLLMAISAVDKRSGYERDGTFSSCYKDGYTFFDCGATCQTFCLAAHSMGIGTCILGWFDPEKAAQIINLPEGEVLPVIVACGYPLEDSKLPRRREINQVLRYID